MQSAIKRLETEKARIVAELRGEQRGNQALIAEVATLKKAINWLKQLSELNVEDVTKYNIVELPDLSTGFSEFRLMDDCESDNREDWIELEERMLLGDIIITRK